MNAVQNERITRSGPGTPCGQLMRHYWQPAALTAEFDPALDPCMALQDEALVGVGGNAAGKQFRSATAGAADGQEWPVTRIMQEFAQPDISFAASAWGMQLKALRRMTEQQMRVPATQSVFPATFVIPLSSNVTITQMHRPVNDTHTYWCSFFTSFAEPRDHAAMRARSQKFISLPDYIPTAGRHDNWGFDAAAQYGTTFLGMGEDDINVHDQWAVESMGEIADRTRKHPGSPIKSSWPIGEC